MKTLAFIFSFCLLAVPHLFCSNSAGKKQPVEEKAQPLDTAKPVSHFQDTLFIEGKSAVFYGPDSLQLEEIRKLMKKGVFESTMHEYENQLRVSHLELKQQWKDVRVMEARNVRFLSFRKENRFTTIDLDKQGDAYGLFAFDPGKEPQKIDMMNMGTQLYYYFKQ